MLELEETDPTTLEYLKENFSVSKSTIPFTSIGSDHALKQDNRMMKVAGGFIGLTQNPLNHFFLIAHVLNSLSEQYKIIS